MVIKNSAVDTASPYTQAFNDSGFPSGPARLPVADIVVINAVADNVETDGAMSEVYCPPVVDGNDSVRFVSLSMLK